MAGRFERGASRRAADLVRPAMLPGEELESYETGLAVLPGREQPQKVELLLTSRSLFVLAEPGPVSRIGLTDIAYYACTEERLAITDASGATIPMTLTRGARELPLRVRDVLLSLPAFTQAYPLGAGTLRLTYHPWRPRALASWTSSLEGVRDFDPAAARGVKAQAVDDLFAAAAGFPQAPGAVVTPVEQRPGTNVWVRAYLQAYDETGEYDFAAGDIVERPAPGQPEVYIPAVHIAAERALHMVQFDDVEPPLPDVLPYAQLVDWKAEGPNGNARHFLLRLLVCTPEVAELGEYEDALHDEGTVMAILRLPSSVSGVAARDALIEGILANSRFADLHRSPLGRLEGVTA